MSRRLCAPGCNSPLPWQTKVNFHLVVFASTLLLVATGWQSVENDADTLSADTLSVRTGGAEPPRAIGLRPFRGGSTTGARGQRGQQPQLLPGSATLCMVSSQKLVFTCIMHAGLLLCLDIIRCLALVCPCIVCVADVLSLRPVVA